jgi:hypothetical protein
MESTSSEYNMNCKHTQLSPLVRYTFLDPPKTTDVSTHPFDVPQIVISNSTLSGNNISQFVEV